MEFHMRRFGTIYQLKLVRLTVEVFYAEQILGICTKPKTNRKINE